MDDRHVFYEARESGHIYFDGRLTDFVERELHEIWRMFYNELYSRKDAIMPYVFISNDTKKLSFGKYSTACLLDLLEKLMYNVNRNKISPHFFDIIKIIMEKLDSVIVDENARIDSTEHRIVITNELYTLERILKEECSDEERELFNYIRSLFGQWKSSRDLLLGKYLADRHQIILYEKAICRNAEQHGVNFYAELSMTLAHELFHAFHYEQDYKNAVWRMGKSGGITTKEKKEIKESLADYIAVYWCYLKGGEYEDVGSERIRAWEARLYSSWPYAKAEKYLRGCRVNNWMPLGSVSINQIREGMNIAMYTFAESFRDVKKAYEMVLE